MAVPLIHVAGWKKTVSKPTWRSGESRVAYRAHAEPVTISEKAADLANQTRTGFAVVENGDQTHIGQRTKRVGPFLFSQLDGVMTVRFQPTSPSRPAPRELGSLETGDCIEVSWNRRTVSGSTGGRMLYVDELWRLWRSDAVAAGLIMAPRPSRRVDMRKILH